MMELFFVPWPPLTVTISLFDTEADEGTDDDDDSVAPSLLLLLLEDTLAIPPIFSLVLFIADVTANIDANGADFDIMFWALDTAWEVGGLDDMGGGGNGKLVVAEGGCLCLFLIFCSSLTFLFKLLNVALNTLLADDVRTTEEEDLTTGCVISCSDNLGLLVRCCFLIKASISSLFWCRI